MQFSRSVSLKAAAAVLALVGLGTTSLAQARSNVFFSIGLPVAPGVSVGISNAPVYYPPQPVYYQQPTYVQPTYVQPAYVQPAPVYPSTYYVQPAPVYVAPAPVIVGSYYYDSYGRRYYHRGHNGGHHNGQYDHRR